MLAPLNNERKVLFGAVAMIGWYFGQKIFVIASLHPHLETITMDRMIGDPCTSRLRLHALVGKPSILSRLSKWLAFLWPYHWRLKMVKSGLI